jgi:subtilase family serine protease
VTCLALVRTDVAPLHGVQSQRKPAGLGALDLRDAYKLPTSGGQGQTIAIINVFDDPKAEADLAVYRAQYGLPPCTTANGCFRKVNATGGTTLPRPDTGWAQEESLDLDMASAACPNCHLLLVEADQASISALGTGVDTAVRLGAKYISNSYGGPEEASAKATDFVHFDHPGVAITAASGDSGYGVLFPATSPRVTAVGGTSLLRATGSGCSAHAVKPSWQ